MSDYRIASPSLAGVLRHESLVYEGLIRSNEIMKICDRPYIGDKIQNLKVIEDYFRDLYGVFTKKLSHFVVESSFAEEDGVRLLAMMQELLKVKKILCKEIK